MTATANTYQPQPADRVLVTRHVNGKVKFVKTGVIDKVALPHGYRFKEDGCGMRFLAASEQVATMPGWTQTIEPLLS